MRFPVLVSYAYARKKLDAFKRLVDRPHVKLLLDSGAFTAKNAGEEIRLEDYCRFLDEWGDRIFRYLALDVVGDPQKTDANLKEMIASGYKPAPVHVLGDDQRRMDELFEMSDYVALAGLRRPHKGSAPKEYVAAKMKWAAGRDVHWLGYVREPMIGAFRPYSCDSASWASVHMYGTMNVYLGQGRWVNGTYQQRRRLTENSEVRAVLNSLGYSIRLLDDKNCWKRSKAEGYPDEMFVSMAVTADSWVRYVIDIKKRYTTRIFLATIMAGSHEETLLNGAIDRHADKLNLGACSV